MSKEEEKPKAAEEDKSTYKPPEWEKPLVQERNKRLDAVYADTTLTSEEKDEKAKEAFRWFQNKNSRRIPNITKNTWSVIKGTPKPATKASKLTLNYIKDIWLTAGIDIV